MRLFCLLGCLLGTALFAAAAKAEPLKFCYEDKMLFPYYMGNGAEIPAERPGASIEHLQSLLLKVPALELQLIRKPWKRCLAALASGEVDAVIASYDANRASFARYPILQQQPDPSRAFAQHQTCLVSQQDAEWSWDGEKIIGANEIVIGRPLGYAALKSPIGQKFHMHYTQSSTMELDLLKKGRINAVTTLCNINGQQFTASFIATRGLKVLKPALSSRIGYLVFSQNFYQQHRSLAELLWDQLAINKGAEIYQRYLNEH